jgi:hypothetical protein
MKWDQKKYYLTCKLHVNEQKGQSIEVARAGPPCAAKTQNHLIESFLLWERMSPVKSWRGSNEIFFAPLSSPLFTQFLCTTGEKNQCGDPQRCISVCTQFVSLYYSVIRK